MNSITISGTLMKAGDKTEILCPRDSGVFDRIILEGLDNLNEIEGSNVIIYGNLKSRKRGNLTVLVKDIYETAELGINFVELEGRICKISEKRIAAKNREVITVILAIGNGYYIPCIFWNSNARTIEKCSIGDKIRLDGRLQSRTFYKSVLDTKIPKTTYEVSVMELL